MKNKFRKKENEKPFTEACVWAVKRLSLLDYDKTYKHWLINRQVICRRQYFTEM